MTIEQNLSDKLWCDLRTDEERSAWLLMGRGYATGVVALSIQADLAMAYHRLSALAQMAAPDDVDSEVIHVPPPALDELLAKADKLASALRGSRVNYAVEQDAANVIWLLMDAVRAQAQDAARYRWLRRQHWSDAPLCVVAHPKNSAKLGHDCPSLDRLDAAIDAQIKEQTP